MPEMNREEIAKLEALYASNPEGRVFTHLAEAYRKAGDFERARKILEQGLTKHPGYASAYVVLGRVHLDVGEAEEAESAFRRVLELDPHNLVALRSLGDSARAAGRRDQALAYFEELRHQDPGNAEIEGFIADLRKTPPAPVEAVEPPVHPEPETESAPPGFAEWSPAAEQESAGDERESPLEPEPHALTEPQPPPEPEPEPVAEAGPGPVTPAEPEPEPESEPEPEPEPVEIETTELEVIATFEEFAIEADYGDLVTPDIELNWEGGEAEQTEEEALPGDLANFAGLNVPLDILDEDAEPEQPPFEEEPPVLDFPDVGEPADIEMEGVEAEADAETQAELVTETMAQLYRDQGLYERSAEVYRALLQERPHDDSLQTNLAEVEALAAIIGADQVAPEPSAESEAPAEEPEPLSFMDVGPDAVEEPVIDFMAEEPEEEVESPWMSAPHPAATDAPNPYTWKEEQPESDVGPPITEYFRGLLAWRPAKTTARPAEASAAAPNVAEPEPEIANFAATPEMESQPAVLDLTLPMEAEAPLLGEPGIAAQPPAIPADDVMPWEEPPSPSMPVAAVTPPAPAPTPSMPSSQDPVEAAFDEWFSAVDEGGPVPPSSQPAQAPPPAAPAQDAATSSGDGEDDDDLEMFRSWLQSLKK